MLYYITIENAKAYRVNNIDCTSNRNGIIFNMRFAIVWRRGDRKDGAMTIGM
jgi:hypothetical protein